MFDGGVDGDLQWEREFMVRAAGEREDSASGIESLERHGSESGMRGS